MDNGAIRFTHVRVPRSALLDRFGTVDKTGRYSSPLVSQARRHVGAVTMGDDDVASLSVLGCKGLCATALSQGTGSIHHP